MRARPRLAPATDVETVIELLCDPDPSPERQGAVREFVIEHFGAFADAMLRVGGRAAAAQREAAGLREQLDRIIGGTQLRGIVTAVTDERVRVQIGPTERVLARPPDLPLGLGQIVYTDGSGQAVLGAGGYLIGGSAHVFVERLEGRHVLVRALRDGQDEARQLALVADCVELDALERDDHVLGYGGIELGNVVLVTRRLGPARPPMVADELGTLRATRREDIVGLDNVLDRLERLFLTAPSPGYARLLAEADRAQVGVVLAGPPGSGKSLVADYIASRVRARGGQAVVRTASSYLIKWVGDGSAKLRSEIAALEKSWGETGVRPLLVIDELEAIALDRSQGLGLHGGTLDVLDTLLALLTRSNVRMIGISNVADRYLDTALLRDGRLPIVQLPATLDARGVARVVANCLANVALVAPGVAA
jgi:hypothetical protein